MARIFGLNNSVVFNGFKLAFYNLGLALIFGSGFLLVIVAVMAASKAIGVPESITGTLFSALVPVLIVLLAVVFFWLGNKQGLKLARLYCGNKRSFIFTFIVSFLSLSIVASIWYAKVGLIPMIYIDFFGFVGVAVELMVIFLVGISSSNKESAA